MSTVRLWVPDEQDGAGEPDRPQEISAALTLPEFFDAAVLPQLDARERRPGTVQIYRDALRWWGKLTRNPPIAGIDQAVVNDFRRALQDARWRRGVAGEWRPLSAWSRTKLLRTLRAVLARLGPGTAARPGEDLVRRVPRLELAVPRQGPKDTWSIDEARTIVAAVDRMTKPHLAGCGAGDWWRAFVASAALTGLRRGTILALRRRHLVERPDGWWLVIEGDAVSKTHRDTMVACHRQLVEVLRRLPATDPEDLLLPWPHHIRTLWTCHAELQRAAGLPAERQYEIHGWRRWHANRLCELGLPERLEATRTALGHSSSAITTGHYLTAHLALVRSLPDLW
jgi:integrase